MKKRKVLAFVLALAMVVTLIPMSAFASSTNTVTRQQVVGEDDHLQPVTLRLEATSDFTLDAGGNPGQQQMRITLNGAEWGYTDPTGSGVRVTDESDADWDPYVTTNKSINWDSSYMKDANYLASAPAVNIYVTKNDTNSNASIVTISSVNVRDNWIDFVFATSATTGGIKDGDVVNLELGIVATGTEGDITVQLDGDNDFNKDTYTVGVIGEGETTARVMDDPEKSWRGTFEAASVEIRENNIAAIADKSNQSIRFTLPSGMEWASGTAISGSLVSGTSILKGNSGQFSWSNNSVAAHSDHSGNGGVDGRDLYVTIPMYADNTLRETIIITPWVYISGSAKMGEVTLAIRSMGDSDISNASGLVIGEYMDEDVTVTTVAEADLPTIIAGRNYEDSTDPYIIEVTVEEEQVKALTEGRFIEFTFPEYVQLVSESGVGGAQVKEPGGGGMKDFPKGDNFKADAGEDTSSFEYEIAGSSLSKKDKYEFEIPVTVEAGTPAGNLVLKVSGSKAGVADTELVVAKIVEPVTVTVNVTDIRTGIQDQAIGDITVKENFVGALMDDATLELVIDEDLNDVKVKNFDKDSVTLVAGDLELQESGIKASGNTMSIAIDSQSVRTPGEIKISGISLNIDRTPAEGKYILSVGGDALVDNERFREHDFDEYVVEMDYLNVITLADTNLYGEATFTIGQSTYDVYINGVVTTRALDAPPYIDPAGRTMVSVKYAANSLGVADNNIIWDQNSKTATIFKDGRVVVFKSGSNQYSMNGANVAMDVTCANVGGRLFIPIAHLANAFGTDYEWDATARTVKLMNKTAGL